MEIVVIEKWDAETREGKYQCIKRELAEETDIICKEYEEIGYKIFDDDKCLFYRFVCVVDCDKNI